MRSWRIAMLFCAFLTLVGCKNDSLDVDVSGLEPKLEFKRLDQDLFALNPSAGKTDTKSLEEKYGQFLTDYAEGILRIGNPESPTFPHAVAQFITEESMKTLYQDVQEEFTEISIIEAELNDAFAHYMYHFPDSTIPEIVFQISALNLAVVSTTTTLGISLDMFLGADYPVYPMVGFPKYLYRNMKPQQVVPQAIKGWVQSMYDESTTRNTMLEHMVYEGKVLYAMEALLRETTDSILIGFTPYEMEWCNTYEARVWAHLVQEELLYETDYMSINKWINQAPFVSGIPKDSPGRLGQWVGLKIVRNYMQNRPETKLTELMTNNNAQEILAQSKYKPKL